MVNRTREKIENLVAGAFTIATGGTFTALGSATFEQNIVVSGSGTVSGSFTVGGPLQVSGTFTSVGSATFEKNIVVKGSSTFSSTIDSRQYGGVGAVEYFIPAGAFQTGVGVPEISNSEFVNGWVFTSAENYATAGVITYWRIPEKAVCASGIISVKIYNTCATANSVGAWLINMAPMAQGESVNAKGTSAFTFTGIIATDANKLNIIEIVAPSDLTTVDFVGGDLVKIGVTYDLKATGAASLVCSAPTFFGLGIEI